MADFGAIYPATRQWMVTTLSIGTQGIRYVGWGSGAGPLTVEASVKTPVYSGFVLKRVTMRVPSNTKDATTNLSIRKNEADVIGTTHTVGAAGITAFDSAELSVSFASGDFISVKADFTTATTGSIVVIITTEYEVRAFA